MAIRRLLLVDPDRRGSYPTDGSKQHAKYVNGANFDTSMVIILAALLCALICALGLNSIVRCALRCGRLMSLVSGTGAAWVEASRTTGLKKKALQAIPVTEYGKGANIPATDCAICLGEFSKGEKVRVLPKCNHVFHVQCIDTWLGSHSSCPTCRSSLFAPAEDAPDQPESGLPTAR